jgi:hypothetical protein
MSQYKEALLRLELQGHSEREPINRNFHQCNYGIQRDYRRKRWNEEAQAKLYSYNIPQTIYIYKEDPNFYDGKYHYKFNTDFSMSNFIRKTVSVRDIHLQYKHQDQLNYDIKPWLSMRFSYQNVYEDPNYNQMIEDPNMPKAYIEDPNDATKIIRDPNQPRKMIHNAFNRFLIRPPPFHQSSVITINIKEYSTDGGVNWITNFPNNKIVYQNANTNKNFFWNYEKKFLNETTINTNDYNPYLVANEINQILNQSFKKQLLITYNTLKLNFQYEPGIQSFCMKILFDGYVEFGLNDFIYVGLDNNIFPLFEWKYDYALCYENSTPTNYTCKFDSNIGKTLLTWTLKNPVYSLHDCSLCASFALWDQFRKVGRTEESHDYLNKEYPYTGGDDFELWICQPSGIPVPKSLFEGSITLELHIEKTL